MFFSKKGAIETLGVDDRWFLIFFAIPVTAFVVPLLFFDETLDNGIIAYLPKLQVSLIYSFAYWITLRAACIYLRQKFPAHRDTRKRLIYEAISIIIVFMIVSRICHFIDEKVFCSHLETALGLPAGSRHNPEVKYDVASFTIIALVVAIYESIFFYDRWKKSIVETESLRRQNIQSQLEGLKNQVNPHFLFNSLNTLSYLIPEDSEKAVKFVQKLSKVYRYILEIKDCKLITLEEELDFLHSYIFLLNERFGKNLSVNLDIPPSAYRLSIVPLSLQILFENAIKHNVISSDKPLQIDVFISKGDQLIVRNNLQKKNLQSTTTKIGLQNIRNRYAYFSEQLVDVIETREYFVVSLPLIQVVTEIEQELWQTTSQKDNNELRKSTI